MPDYGWNWGGPPPRMTPGVVIERAGSLSGGVVVVNNVSVATPDGNMLVQQTQVEGKETYHYTSHPNGPAHTHYPPE
jgi:hypothetical protein